MQHQGAAGKRGDARFVQFRALGCGDRRAEAPGLPVIVAERARDLDPGAHAQDEWLNEPARVRSAGEGAARARGGEEPGNALGLTAGLVALLLAISKGG